MISEQQKIPPLILRGLRDYADDHREPGGFLGAVLRNDLTDAVCRADGHSLAAIREIVLYCCNCIPAGCWGDDEAVMAWLEIGAECNRIMEHSA